MFRQVTDDEMQAYPAVKVMRQISSSTATQAYLSFEKNATA